MTIGSFKLRLCFALCLPARADCQEEPSTSAWPGSMHVVVGWRPRRRHGRDHRSRCHARPANGDVMTHARHAPGNAPIPGGDARSDRDGRGPGLRTQRSRRPDPSDRRHRCVRLGRSGAAPCRAEPVRRAAGRPRIVLPAASTTTFHAVVLGIGDVSPDPTVRIERVRTARPDGVDESIRIRSTAVEPVRLAVALAIQPELTPLQEVRERRLRSAGAGRRSTSAGRAGATTA